MNSAVTQEVKQRISLRSVTAIAMIAVGLGLLGGGAFIAVKQFQEAQLPAVKPLKDGTYAPAQVVFKVKAGKDANAIVKKALAKKQTVYKNKATGKTVASYDAAVKKTPASFQKQDVQLTQKSLRQIFPKVTISDEVKAKIAIRNGAQDPDAVYSQLGMDRWYVAEVNQVEADVPTIIQQLAGDKINVEKVQANGIMKMESVASTTPKIVTEDNGESQGGSSQPLLASGQAATCSNPNDPYSCSAGNIPGTPTDQWYLDAINARAAWAISKGSAKTIIAVVDTGVDVRHPDFKNKIWVNSTEDINHNGCADYWGAQTTSRTDVMPEMKTDCQGNLVYGDLDGVDNDGNNYIDDLNGVNFTYNYAYHINYKLGPIDSNGHGTLDAGIIGAAANTDTPTGIAGVCPDCLLMPLGTGSGIDSRTVSGAWSYAVDNGADIINFSGECSVAGGINCDVLLDALSYVTRAGVIMVAPSGNENNDFMGDNYIPAINPEVIVVGATNAAGDRSYLNPNPCTSAEDGSTMGSSWGSNLTVMAPGEKILGPMGYLQSPILPGNGLCLLGQSSCTPPVDYGCEHFGIIYDDPSRYEGYIFSSGTSHAAPIVSGIVGLMKSVNPALGPYDIKNILTDSARDITSATDENGQYQYNLNGWDQYTGFGMVQADTAVQVAKNSIPDLIPEVNYTSAETLGSTILRLRTSITNLNSSIYGVSRVLVRFTDQNGTTLYEETIDRLASAWQTILYDKTINGTMPTKINVIIDPLHTLTETNTTNNTLANVPVVAFGTPMFQPLPAKTASPGTTITIPVSATTGAPVDPVTIQITASNLPSGAQFSNRQFTWTPTAETINGTYQPLFSATVTVPAAGSTPAYTVTNTAAAIITMTGGKTPVTFEYSSASAVYIGAQNKIHIRFVTKNVSASTTGATTWTYFFIPGGNPILSQPCSYLRSGGSIPSLTSGNSFSTDVYVPVYESCEGNQVSISTRAGTISLEKSPVFTPAPNQSAQVGTQLELSLSANNNSPSVAYSVDPATLPSGANLIGRTFFWTPTPDQSGQRVVRFTASNEAGSTTQDVQITVAPPTQPPQR